MFRTPSFAVALAVAPAVILAATTSATSAYAQNNGLPTRYQSVVLVEVIAQRGESCGLLRPWEAASLQTQLREEAARLSDAERVTVAKEVDTRLAAMTCDDSLLNSWIKGAKPGFDREHLPELLTAYRAMSSLERPPAAFTQTAKRTDFAAAHAMIDAKIAALDAAGVKPSSGMTWQALADRQAGFASQIAAAIAGTNDAGRFSAAQATQLAEDVARIVELWLADSVTRADRKK